MLTEQSKRNKRIASLKSIRDRQSVITGDLTGQDEQLAYRKKALEVMNEMMKTFKKIFLDSFEEHSNLDLYTFNFQLQDHMVDSLHNMGTLCAHDISPFEQFNMNVEHYHTRSLRGR